MMTKKGVAGVLVHTRSITFDFLSFFGLIGFDLFVRSSCTYMLSLVKNRLYVYCVLGICALLAMFGCFSCFCCVNCLL